MSVVSCTVYGTIFFLHTSPLGLLYRNYFFLNPVTGHVQTSYLGLAKIVFWEGIFFFPQSVCQIMCLSKTELYLQRRQNK